MQLEELASTMCDEVLLMVPFTIHADFISYLFPGGQALSITEQFYTTWYRCVHLMYFTTKHEYKVWQRVMPCFVFSIFPHHAAARRASLRFRVVCLVVPIGHQKTGYGMNDQRPRRHLDPPSSFFELKCALSAFRHCSVKFVPRSLSSAQIV